MQPHGHRGRLLRRRRPTTTPSGVNATVATVAPGMDNILSNAVVTPRATRLWDLLGARRQSVTRVMAELRTRGLVSTGYGVTVVDDPDGLREVMGAAPLLQNA